MLRSLARSRGVPPAVALSQLLGEFLPQARAPITDVAVTDGAEAEFKVRLDGGLAATTEVLRQELGLTRVAIVRLAIQRFVGELPPRLPPEDRRRFAEAVVALNRVGNNLNGLLRDERTAAARGELPDVELHRYRQLLEELEGARRRIAAALAPYEHAGA
ncbi:hypothetical protein [Tistlia consotensis]|uniref:Mobilisation protein (MobC) n=1 Tax=Tistlia consotensis USBA 355 TaxID=560819 RepID=A0A1Y6C0A7_9PROT|nr:hypothetical protein [Tistlia consotensis]SMF27272.1 hypothetical protein SAMN05428998_10973 [Tistlia consotensis USBA 355]